MPVFVVNTPIESTDPRIEVTVSANSPLRVGRHRFQLVVFDDSGNQSLADAVEVRVFDGDRPTAVLQGPEQVAFAQSFPLTGERSTDVGGGRIVRYVFTYLGPVDVPITPTPAGPATPVTPTRPGTPVTPAPVTPTRPIG